RLLATDGYASGKGAARGGMGGRKCTLESLEMSQFWRRKRVLLTGHTGFKGAWTALWLEQLGANVTGFALAPPDDRECVFTCAGPWTNLTSVMGDLRDPSAVARAIEASDPEIVIHMAAQALVKRSYADPGETFGTNVMGTVNLLTALRNRPRS